MMSRQSGRCRRRWSTARPGPPSGREEAANGIHVKLPVGVPGRKAGEAARRRHGRARPDQVAVRRGNGCGRAVVLAGEGAGDGSLGPVIETYAIGAAAAATGGGGEIVLPQVIVATGPAAVGRFLEFFVGTIAHATRAAYARTVGHFPGVVRGATTRAARRLAASTWAVYIRTHPGSVPTVKQHLAAIRMLGDWLVVSQVLPVNPPPGCEGRSTSSQRARRRSSRQRRRGRSSRASTRLPWPGSGTERYSRSCSTASRGSAVLAMRRQDYFGQGRRGWLRLREKGGEATRRPGPSPRGRGPRRLPQGVRARRAEGAALPDREGGGEAADGPGAQAAARPGDGQASRPQGCRP